MRLLFCLLLVFALPVAAQEEDEEEALRQQLIELSTNASRPTSFVSNYTSNSLEIIEIDIEGFVRNSSVNQALEGTWSVSLGDDPYGRGSLTANVTETGELDVEYDIEAEIRYVEETLFVKPVGTLLSDTTENLAFLDSFDDTWRIVDLETEEAQAYNNLNLDAFTGIFTREEETARLAGRILDFLPDANTITEDATVINGRQTQLIIVGFVGEDVVNFLQEGGVFAGDSPLNVAVREQLAEQEDETLVITFYVQGDQLVGRELIMTIDVALDPQVLDENLPEGGSFTLNVALTETEIISAIDEPIPLVGKPAVQE